MAGAGRNLHDLIVTWTGEEPNLSCSCEAWIRKMDRNLAWAKNHVEMIVSKLMREAKGRVVKWRAVPVHDNGTLLNALRSRAWKGAFLIPGSGVLLEPFVRMMVETAIRRAEERGGQSA
jgi:hypothetical protein